MKRTLAYVLILMLLLTIVIGCTAAPAEPPADSPETTAPTVDEEVFEMPTDEPQEGFSDVIKVRVGSGPYPHYQSFFLAKEWGIDDLFGLDFEISAFNNSAVGYEACVRGDVDITYGCIAEQVAVMQGAPDIRNFAYVGYFKGFFFVGRKGEMTEWSDLVAEMGLDEAIEYRRNEFKGKTICVIPQKISLVVDMLEQVGLSEDDVEFLQFADDQKGATAFMSGSGDIYIGGIPQQMTLTKMDEFINLGGYEILGPAGVWYDTMASTDEFMLNNREAALRTLACMLFVEGLFERDMQTFSEVCAAELTRLSGAEYTVEDFIDMQTIYDEYQTYDLLDEGVFNPESHLYWMNPVAYNIRTALNDGILDDTMSLDEYCNVYFGESEKLFKELQGREDLMALLAGVDEYQIPA